MDTYKHPHGNIFYRNMHKAHPKIVRGEGVYLYNAEGKRYLDGSGGAIVVNAGHGVQSIAEAIGKQAGEAAYLHARMFTSEVIETYAQALTEIVPLPDPKFYFLTSGSEAVEAAIKLARQIQIERGENKRHLTISRWMSYHGLSLGALAVTGKEKMRAAYQSMFQDMPHIPPPYCYRCPLGLVRETCDLACANALEAEIQTQGAENVSAFLAEPVSGATLGAVVPPDGYWARIREICDRYGVLLIADEVMTGMGRTGKWFAVEHWDLTPDILTIGKGAASGYFPLSIVVVKGEHVDLIARGSGDFNHGGTYSHHAVGAAAGLATLNYLRANQLVERSAALGQVIHRALNQHLRNLTCVGDIRGMGTMWGIEFVQDQATRQPFEPILHFSQKLGNAAFARGLILYPGSGCADGYAGDHIMFAPPFVITESQIESSIEILLQSIIAVQKQAPNPLR
ncbi:MAG: aminotransferase class III-fold pyridoxal phosphate-dependent enzyme [Anaerolineales bacterium]|nr:aminotransferase class III-fold pyridoxal phosphate-dependent enzyme [Anaerolineales bacterium]